MLSQYSPVSRPVRLLDASTISLQELFYAFEKPHVIETKKDWVNWAFALKSQADHRYGQSSSKDGMALRLPLLERSR